MKKSIWIASILFVAGICAVSLIYTNYRDNLRELKKQNNSYEYYVGKEVYGSDITTIMNKAIDNNEKNGVKKDQHGLYIDNGETSIQIDIKMTEVDKTYSMEAFYKVGIKEFISTFHNVKFKCTKIKYHEKTGKVKYLLFEEII